MTAPSGSVPAITLAALRATVGAPGGDAGPDRSGAAFRAATAPGPDLALPGHRAALLDWLNAWGCRIRRPRPGEADVFGASVAGWWDRWRDRLPGPEATLATLADGDVDVVAAAYDDLVAHPAAVTATGGRRRVGPTAAAKALHALRPAAVVPWDDAIAVALHGDRSAAAFAAHQRVGRAAARALLDEAGTPEPALAAALGRPGTTLARLLDEHLWAAITLAGRRATQDRAPAPAPRSRPGGR